MICIISVLSFFVKIRVIGGQSLFFLKLSLMWGYNLFFEEILIHQEL